MEQPKSAAEIVKVNLHQIRNLSQTPTTSLTKQEQEKATLIQSKFGNRDQFLQRVNPQTQASFGLKPDKAITGDYPTLTDLNLSYGKTFAEQWLYPQIADLSLFTGAKNLSKEQIQSLASVIAVEYRYLKVTELLLFFHRFKAGNYGRFYGNVDPMVITCALKDFLKERNLLLDQYERERNNLECELRSQKPRMSYEEYLRVKELEKSQEL